MNRRRVIPYAILFIVYAILFVLGTGVIEPLPNPNPRSRGEVFILFGCLAVAAGIIEAIAAVYTGERRNILSWLPPVAGFVADLVVNTNYQDPDLSTLGFILVMMILGWILLFVIVVHVTATGILWLRQLPLWPKRSI